MPSCVAQDTVEELFSSVLTRSIQPAALAPEAAFGQPAAFAQPAARAQARREPAQKCDPDWCRIADRDLGKRCAPGKCWHRGIEEPRVKCEGELAAAPARRGASVAEKKDAARARTRVATLRDLGAAADRLAKALKKARTARVLAPGEDDMLRVVEGWKKMLAAEGKARRRK
ncbi:MAG TPA: hypothetical protein VFL83_13375 [Anaeromyxobacter sp.]|nr:hypothetical protein [Anaeromyxobacter sp.]